MLRKLGCFVMAMGLAVPLWAGEGAGSISGHVRTPDGMPQMGAMVEVLGSAARTLKAFTDAQGFYSISGLLPGMYSLKISAPYFLPVIRQHVGLHPGSGVLVNVTLNTLFQAVQIAPSRSSGDDDDWKWVLRSASNRPILRALDDDAALGTPEDEKPSHNLTGRLSFLAGSPSTGFGSASDMSTGFAVERSIFSSGTVGLRGSLGYGDGSPAAIVRASYRHKLGNGSEPEVAFTMRNLPAPAVNLRNSSLQALALTTSDGFTLGDVVELKFGSELQTLQFMGRVTAFRPFGSVGVHLSPNTVVQYRYSSAEPDSRLEKGFESAPGDFSEAQPRVSMASYAPALERAHHQEVSISQRVGANSLQFAMYTDRVNDPALTGVGEMFTTDGETLPDPYSGTFTYQGRNLDTRGFRMVFAHKFTSDVTGTVEYAYGGALVPGNEEVDLRDVRQAMQVKNRDAVSAKLSGGVPHAKTQWIASYRWTSGTTLTPVDMFDDSPGRTDPYLGVFLRQPIPGTGFLPGRMDAVVDIRNLLAQGYVPVMGNDGRTVYLVQAARSIRGGVAFTF